jgi:Ca2+-binding EF-hand superfamily protein
MADAPQSPAASSSSSSSSSGADDTENDRLDSALTLVRQMSSAHLKEQCLMTEWTAMDTAAERDLLLEVVSDGTFWEDVKAMTLNDVDAMPPEDDGEEGDTDSRLLQMFKAFDKDNSGTIDANELHQMFLYMGITTTENEVREMIEQVDENGDGDIDEGEFLLVMKKAQSGALSPRSQRASAKRAIASREE